MRGAGILSNHWWALRRQPGHALSTTGPLVKVLLTKGPGGKGRRGNTLDGGGGRRDSPHPQPSPLQAVESPGSRTKGQHHLDTALVNAKHAGHPAAAWGPAGTATARAAAQRGR
uniref:Uncharacterized protein n=1 Tax=Eutreptiella gymnastica TaxID=73025 RepID=A0A7S1NG58_9EUGL